jgi:hypothetical protein
MDWFLALSPVYAAVEPDEEVEPADPHPDTPDDLDDDCPVRESVEAVPDDESSAQG